MARSACGVSTSVSVALSLTDTGSLTPGGAETLTVLTRNPVADGETVPAKV
jgi:hypothetical protein